MVLADKDGCVWYDGERPSEHVAQSVISNATLNKHPQWPLLFRVEESGVLTMYDVSRKPFTKVVVTPYDMQVFRDRREVYTETAHIYELCHGMAQIIGEGFMFPIPVEMLYSD